MNRLKLKCGGEIRLKGESSENIPMLSYEDIMNYDQEDISLTKSIECIVSDKEKLNEANNKLQARGLNFTNEFNHFLREIIYTKQIEYVYEDNSPNKHLKDWELHLQGRQAPSKPHISFLDSKKQISLDIENEIVYTLRSANINIDDCLNYFIYEIICLGRTIKVE